MAYEPVPINYVEPTYEELFQIGLELSFSKGLLSLDPQVIDFISNKDDIENSLVLEASVNATMFMYAYNNLTVIKNGQSIKDCPGDDLDANFGEQFGVPRYDPEYAVTEILLSCENPAESNIDIPVGTVVYQDNENNIEFRTTELRTLLETQTQILVPVKCTVAGTAGNIEPNTLNKLGEVIEGIDSVTNPQGAFGGKPRESHEAYRMRLLRWKYEQDKGNYDAVLAAIQSVSAVQGYYVAPRWDGDGTTKIVIDPPMDTVIDLVKSALHRVKAIDENYLVVKVETIAVNISSIINISIDQAVPPTQSQLDVIKIKVMQCIRTFIEGGTDLYGDEREPLGTGRDFIPFELGVYIKNQIPEVRNVTFEYPTTQISVQLHEKATLGTCDVRVV